MSRTATATPPPPLFHQKNTTPSARHAAKGSHSSPAPGGFQRHFKKQSKSSIAAPAAITTPTPLKLATEVAPMSAGDMLGIDHRTPQGTVDPLTMSRTGSTTMWRDSDTASIATSVPSMSTTSSDSDSLTPSLATPETTPSSSVYGDGAEILPQSATMGQFGGMPPMATPSPRSWVNGFGKMARAAGMMNPFGRRRDGESPRVSATSPAGGSSSNTGSPIIPMSPYIAPSPASMAASMPALVSPVAFKTTPAMEPSDLEVPLPPHALPPALAHPHAMPPALMPDSPNIDNPAEALRRFEWADMQRKYVTECARLCSQWPQSGYNLAKWGPNGCPSAYVPQSWANPKHVVKTMQRQAELERHLCHSDATFFSSGACEEQQPASTRSSSTDCESSAPSLFSFVSSQSSVATSIVSSTGDDGSALCAAVWQSSKIQVEVKKRGGALTQEEAVKATEQRTAADLRAAMSSPLVEGWRNGGSASIISVSSIATSAAEDTAPPSAWMSLANSTKSLSELDHMAELATTDRMDVDDDVALPSVLSSIPTVPDPHPRCPAKRPLGAVSVDEEKRRKVDELMVVDTPTLTDEPAVLVPAMSASAPQLQPPMPMTLFGHVVKTSNTHPIIISPFIPTEILSVLSKYVVTPVDHQQSSKPLLLSSDLDVPALLLSCAPPAQCASEAGPMAFGMPPSCPRTLIFNGHRSPNGVRRQTPLGNLLLSSCPGKRLRMDGPVKGRGPVCRDLAIDLRRIRSEGVGAIVCCLDDDELALLGVPWETYRDTAAEIGLDVIRLPMADGFTPVSLQFFDAQVSLIATRYTMKGINVLIHCRGGIGRAGLTACAWAIKMGFVQPHPSLGDLETVSAARKASSSPQTRASSRRCKASSSGSTGATEEDHCIVMSVVERVIAMIRSRRGLKAIESYEQVQFLATYVAWLRESIAV